MSIQNIRRSVLIVAGAGALAVAGLVAGRLAAGVIPGGAGPRHFGPPRLARIARALDLTADQTSRIKGILRSHAPEIESQMRSGSDARRGLRDAILADPIDETAIRAKAADLARVEGDGAVLFARIRAEIFPILTDEQKQKIERFHQRARGRGDRAAKAFEQFLNDEGS
ncbi:MAG: Spy/CpxP family protein refolding chaperone [Acidobacteriota bacterium]